MRKANAAFDALLGALAALAAAIFAAIALLIPLNVALKALGIGSIYGLLEATEYGMLAATFLAAPWVLARNAHVSVDLVTAALPEGARRRTEIVTNLLGAAAALLFLVYAVEALMVSATRGSMIRTAFVIPEWWTLTAAPLSMVLILVEFLRKIAAPAAERARVGL